jgi:hypothetical protein
MVLPSGNLTEKWYPTTPKVTYRTVVRGSGRRPLLSTWKIRAQPANEVIIIYVLKARILLPVPYVSIHLFNASTPLALVAEVPDPHG